MSHEVKRAERGSLVLDARPLGDFLVDAAPRNLVGIRRAQDGFDAVLEEIFDNQPAYGAKAGVLQSEVDELRLLNERIALIHKHLPAAQKLVEMMLETEALMDNRRQEIVRNVAKSIDARVATLKDDALFGKYELTRKYRSAQATKAAKTRKKNAATQANADDKA